MMLKILGFYLFIFVIKVSEVTLSTTRIVMITKGERLKGAVIGFFEVTLWVIVASFVLGDITSDPIKVVVYALGFAIGNYLGSIFEEFLGVGTVRVEAIVKEVDGEPLVKMLRENDFAVTVVHGDGMNHKRQVLIMHVARKQTSRLVELIKKYQSNVVITINEVKPIYGGYGTIRK